MSALTLDRIVVRRGARAVLNGVSAIFAPGRITAVIGPNGAGKSTLLAAAAGLLTPDAGTVTLGGVPLPQIDRRALARRRGYLPQNPRVEWPISVERVVALGLVARLPAFGPLPDRWRAAIDAALDRHDLIQLRDRPATQLSGGELARVMMARATVGEPEVLIADEPSAGLDPRHVVDTGAALGALAARGCTVVVALHDLTLALRIADDFVALRDGALFAAGPAKEVLRAEPLSALYDVPVTVGEGSVSFG